MGLFSKKKKVSVDDMAMQMMLAAVDVVGKLDCFHDIDDSRSFVVNTGYFYGFLKLHLNSITKSDTATTIIEKSIAHMENVTKGQASLENTGNTVKAIANKAVENMKYISATTDNIFMGMSVFYITDLHNSNEIDIGKVDIAEKNMRTLYGTTSNLTKDIKIVK